MSSRISRYYGLPDVVDQDPRKPGRNVVSTALRVLPDVHGTFQHTIVDGDRLDQLAFLYYQQPGKWWRICDANPEFLSPLEMLGRGPLRTVRVPLAVPAGGQPGWAALAVSLAAEPGVERFRFVDDPRAGQDLAVVVTYNRFVVGESALRGLAGKAGFRAEPPEVVGRAGKRITVPPDTAR
ncbi:hypothetical protein ABZ801_11430 [Actinomadura sp. NPDC047616]|uniref:hypothetical protein n=1 Tax=Actinomadura sp. NPDC047616 TaxID=3155914 RepID=UPI0033F39316